MARAFLIILMTFLTTQYCICQNTWCDYDNRIENEHGFVNKKIIKEY